MGIPLVLSFEIIRGRYTFIIDREALQAPDFSQPGIDGTTHTYPAAVNLVGTLVGFE